MSDYPIPVKNLSGNKAMLIICQKCRAEERIHPDQLLNEGFYRCPKDCGGSAVYKYEQADECRNCGKLGWFVDELDHCCSRPCLLQAEYAKELAARKATA